MKKKTTRKTKTKHAFSHRNLANLTECFFKTNFVLLTKTFLYLCRRKKPWSMRIVANLHGREKFIGALRDKPRRPCDMRSAQDLCNFSSGWPPWIANVCCLSSLLACGHGSLSNDRKSIWCRKIHCLWYCATGMRGYSERSSSKLYKRSPKSTWSSVQIVQFE